MVVGAAYSSSITSTVPSLRTWKLVRSTPAGKLTGPPAVIWLAGWADAAVVNRKDMSTAAVSSLDNCAFIDQYPFAVSYTHLRAHETRHDLVCRLLLEKKTT